MMASHRFARALLLACAVMLAACDDEAVSAPDAGAGLYVVDSSRGLRISDEL